MIIGSGIDIVEVRRIREVVNRWGDKFLNRVFTDRELDYCNLKGSFKFQSLAARFAAKEAIVKALGRKDLALKDIEVLNDGDGKPTVGKRSKNGMSQILLSISHTDEYAVASALVVKK